MLEQSVPPVEYHDSADGQIYEFQTTIIASTATEFAVDAAIFLALTTELLGLEFPIYAANSEGAKSIGNREHGRFLASHYGSEQRSTGHQKSFELAE